MTMNRRVPGSVAVALIALTATLGPTVAAVAAPPEIHQKDCEAAGGTFDRAKGVKTCTTTAQITQVSPTMSAFYDGGFFSPSYRSFYNVQSAWQVTTTDTQKGNGDVTSEQTSTLISRQVVNQRCDGTLFGSYYPATVSDCAAHGLYPMF